MSYTDTGVALQYSGDAPRILAIARGELLKELLTLAEKYHITIYKDPDLAEILSKFDLGTEIPVDLYHAVAEILAYCYSVNVDFRHKIDTMGKQ